MTDGAQRFFERGDGDERGNLAGEERELLGGQVLAEADAALEQGGDSGGHVGAGFDADDVELARVELGAGVFQAGGDDAAAAFAAAGVEGEIIVARHLRWQVRVP